MKKLLTLFLFCLSLFVFSQDIKRENVDGKIIVEGADIEGVTVFNVSSSVGTTTDVNGEFVISVTLNDLLEIRAVEYEKFDVIINEDIIESKLIHIFLIEEINKLDEVVVKNKKLTGDLRTDVNNVQTFSPKKHDIYFGIKNSDAYDPSEARMSQIENIAMQSQTPTTVLNGLNVVNIVDQLLIPLFRSEVKDKKASGIPAVPPKSIKYFLGSNFLIENFKIPEHRVEEFIRYVEDESFDFDFLNYGHEIEFLELLNKKSKTFLNI